MEITRCTEADYEILAGIWERSVKASHDFLAENDFNSIKASLIPLYFPNVELYAIHDNGVIVGFAGLCSQSIEMLFVDSECRGLGYGSALVDFAKRCGATKVDVNEQNISALSFYQAKKFRIVGRNDTDDAGRPYPILHLSL